MQNLKHFKHNLVEQPLTEQLNIVFELQLMQDISDFVLGQFEHDNEQFLQPTKWEPLKEAMRNLSGNGFKLYMYLLSWEGQKYYDFSPSGIHKSLHISDEGARNARDELIDKGYIILINDLSFIY